MPFDKRDQKNRRPQEYLQVKEDLLGDDKQETVGDGDLDLLMRGNTVVKLQQKEKKPPPKELEPAPQITTEKKSDKDAKDPALQNDVSGFKTDDYARLLQELDFDLDSDLEVGVEVVQPINAEEAEKLSVLNKRLRFMPTTNQAQASTASVTILDTSDLKEVAQDISKFDPANQGPDLKKRRTKKNRLFFKEDLANEFPGIFGKLGLKAEMSQPNSVRLLLVLSGSLHAFFAIYYAILVLSNR